MKRLTGREEANLESYINQRRIKNVGPGPILVGGRPHDSQSPNQNLRNFFRAGGAESKKALLSDHSGQLLPLVAGGISLLEKPETIASLAFPMRKDINIKSKNFSLYTLIFMVKFYTNASVASRR